MSKRQGEARLAQLRKTGKVLHLWRSGMMLTAAECGSRAGVSGEVWRGWELGFYRPGLDRAIRVEKLTHGAVRVEAWNYDDATVRALLGFGVQRWEAARESKPHAVYVATHLPNLAAARRLASALRARDVEVVSTWHGEDDLSDAGLPRARRRAIAAQVEAELASATALAVLFVPGGRGTLIEFGLACGRRLPIYAMGDWTTQTPLVEMPGVVWVSEASDVEATGHADDPVFMAMRGLVEVNARGCETSVRTCAGAL